MKTRIYEVTDATNKKRMVEAISISQALRHVAEDTFTCKVLGGVDAAKLALSGVKLETACDRKDAAL